MNANGRTWESHIILLPAYCGMGEHGQQATQSSPFVRCGVVAVEIEAGGFNRNRSTAVRQLNELVDRGFLVTEYPVMVKHRQCRVWRRAYPDRPAPDWASIVKSD